MCGFVGLLNPTGLATERVTPLVARMRDQVVHRGPDDAGLWMDGAAGIALGSRRLAISDLSTAGHQPMFSADGRLILALNGEVYNASEIRTDIEAASGPVAWRGHSDTEVLVEAIALWGLESALRRINGMFALAVWDRRDRCLSLARDRMGKKPLYYGWAGRDFVFGSELKALRVHPDFDASIDPHAMAGYLRLGYVLGSRCIFSAIQKLPAGQLLRVGPATTRGSTPQPMAYWSLRDVALAGLEARQSAGRATVEGLEATVRDAVAIRMVADVPVGLLLSGGVDSSLIAALMARSAPNPVQTFSIGYDLPAWDERGHARAVASHLGARHSETMIGSADVLAVVRDLPAIFDEPFADDSRIPMTLLSRAARRGVTVALSGDGGDELFAGYDRYSDAARWLARRRATPNPLRLLAGATAGAVAPLAHGLGWQRIERRLTLFQALIANGGADAFNAAIMSRALDPGALTPLGRGAGNPLLGEAYRLGRGTDIDQIMFMDASSFLVDDILTKVDRASMAASLEVRCPLLDHRVVALSWRFPAGERSRGGRGKLPLREILHRHVPPKLVERPKMGFSAPVQIWLLGCLREWAESLFDRTALAGHGLLDVAACRAMWEDFSRRGRAWNPTIWSVLMFQAWYGSMDRPPRDATRLLDPMNPA